MKEVKTTYARKNCSKCKEISVRSDKGYKISMGILGIASLLMVPAFFMPVSMEYYSLSLLLLIIALIAWGVAAYRKPRTYTCTKCKHVEKIQ